MISKTLVRLPFFLLDVILHLFSPFSPRKSSSTKVFFLFIELRLSFFELVTKSFFWTSTGFGPTGELEIPRAATFVPARARRGF